MKQYEKLTDDDLADIETAYYGPVNRQEVEEFLANTTYDHLHEARKWGWSDTPLRDSMYTDAQRLGIPDGQFPNL